MADDFQAIIDAGQLLSIPRKVGSNGTYAIIPEGAELQSLEAYLDAPLRTRRVLTVHDQASFIAYVTRFKTPATAVFADRGHFRFTAIIDYDEPGKPAFGDHQVVYDCPRSAEWKTWTGVNEKMLQQVDFARFMEDNVVDVRSPAAAEMLEISRSLHAKRKVDFSSDVRLTDGTRQLTYNEVLDGVTTKGNLKIPESFTLGIPVFFGDQPYEVTARLRYRINDSRLTMGYSLYRPQAIEEDAFAKVGGLIQAGIAIPIWQGSV